MPQCYQTCDLYRARKDGKCRRFWDGISPIFDDTDGAGIQPIGSMPSPDPYPMPGILPDDMAPPTWIRPDRDTDMAPPTWVRPDAGLFPVDEAEDYLMLLGDR